MDAQQSALVGAAAQTTSEPRKSFLARHPLIGYFVLAYAGTWLTLLPVVLSQNGVGVLPYSMPFLLFAVLFVLSGLTGPTLSAFIMTAVTEGRTGVRQLRRRYVQWRVGPQWYLIVLFGFVLLNLVALTFALGATPWEALAQKWPLIFVSYLPAVLTFNLVTSFGEEPGWRGFALPRLQKRYGPLLGTFILGTLHAAWHLPVFLLPALGFGQFTVSFFLTWIPAVWATSIIFTWMANGAKGSLLLAILMHSAADAAGTLVLSQIVNVTALGAAVAARVSTAEFVVLLGAAALLVVFTRGKLGYQRDAPAKPQVEAAPAATVAEIESVASHA